MHTGSDRVIGKWHKTVVIFSSNMFITRTGHSWSGPNVRGEIIGAALHDKLSRDKWEHPDWKSMRIIVGTLLSESESTGSDNERLGSFHLQCQLHYIRGLPSRGHRGPSFTHGQWSSLLSSSVSAFIFNLVLKSYHKWYKENGKKLMDWFYTCNSLE